MADIIQIEVEIEDIPGLPNNVLFVEFKKEDFESRFEEMMETLRKQVFDYADQHYEKNMSPENKITSNVLLDRLVRQLTMHMATKFHCQFQDSPAVPPVDSNKYTFTKFDAF